MKARLGDAPRLRHKKRCEAFEVTLQGPQRSEARERSAAVALSGSVLSPTGQVNPNYARVVVAGAFIAKMLFF